ncbi:MAG: 30S ribosomal protein S7 [Anaerolineales bacterium]|nr:30S ribosomal protein S7 [Anaerolineales bacterium]MCS7248567.1 30S ribosomal protein S7 [Anaerolineales bacterium]MDW8162380.1 30S ribosomal protein S7 [Anaerolineales bacterium]MDW8447252.1 30S ribosomal protein S7 [Anaerolineales bacterium]
MARRNKPERFEIPPDVRYNSVEVQSFINRVMRRGKKSLATRLVYTAFDLIQAKTKRNPVEVFEEAIKNVAPLMEVKPRRVGGATYQVPVEVPPYRRFSLASRWIIAAAKARSGKSFPEKLAAELLDAANNTGAAVRKRDETHKMAEANRAFSHYRI